MKIHHSNEYLIAKIGVDTVENEPSKVSSCLPTQGNEILQKFCGVPPLQVGSERSKRAVHLLERGWGPWIKRGKRGTWEPDKKEEKRVSRRSLGLQYESKLELNNKSILHLNLF